MTCKRISLAFLILIILSTVIQFGRDRIQSEKDRIQSEKDRIAERDKIHLNLVKVAEEKFKFIQILHDNTFHNNFLFKEVSANRYCNSSRITLIFITSYDLSAICSKILSFLPQDHWKSLPSYQKKNSINCESFSRKEPTINLEYEVYKIKAMSTGINYVDSFSSSFFPPNSTFPYFIPIPEGLEYDVVQLAKPTGKNFYFISYSYQGPYDERKYPCSETGMDECKCAYNTFSKYLFYGEKEKTWSK